MASKGKTLRLCFKEIQHELFENNRKTFKVIFNFLNLKCIFLDNNESLNKNGQ